MDEKAQTNWKLLSCQRVIFIIYSVYFLSSLWSFLFIFLCFSRLFFMLCYALFGGNWKLIWLIDGWQDNVEPWFGFSWNLCIFHEGFAENCEWAEKEKLCESTSLGKPWIIVMLVKFVNSFVISLQIHQLSTLFHRMWVTQKELQKWMLPTVKERNVIENTEFKNLLTLNLIELAF